MQNSSSSLIQKRISELFETGKFNCSMTALAVLSELYYLQITQQTINAAQSLPGAGGVGDLCGFVSGYLMFIGVWGGYHNLERADLMQMSSRLSQSIQNQFGSLQCRELRGDCSIFAVEFFNFITPLVAEETEKLLSNKED